MRVSPIASKSAGKERRSKTARPKRGVTDTPENPKAKKVPTIPTKEAPAEARPMAGAAAGGAREAIAGGDDERAPMIPTEYTLVGSKLEAHSVFKSPDYLPSYQFPYNPDPLCRGNNYSKYDEMQDDDQVKAALAVKKDMVVNTGWQIVCEDDAIREYLTDSLKRVNQSTGTGAGGFDDALRDMLSAYSYGFSMTEPVYKLDEKTGWWTFSELRTRPPHSFQFVIDDKGYVEKIQQSGAGMTHDFGKDVFLHHVYQQEFGNPYGRSDLRAAYTSYVAKKFVMRFYNIYLERYASPTIVGKYKPTFTKPDIAELLSILQQMQQNTAMVIPEDAMVDFVQAARDSSGSYGDALDKYDTKIARAILMPDLLGFSGSKTGGGSYSLGKEQFKAFLGVIKKDRESLQNLVTERMIKPVAAANWGEEVAATISFQFVPFSDDSIVEGAKLWTDAVKSGMWVPTDEEINHLRGITGFPEGEVERKPDPVQFDAEGNPIEPAGGLPGKGGKPPKPGEEGDEADEDEEAGGDKPKPKFKPQGARMFNLRTYAHRKMTAYEKKVDFEGVLNVLTESEERAMPPLRRSAKAIYSDLIAQVRDKGLLTRFRPEAIADLKPHHMKDMNMAFRNHFTDLFKGAAKSAKHEIYQGVKGYAKGDEVMMPDDFLRILQAETFKVVGDYTMEITKKAKNILMQGLKDGVSEGSVVALLRDELESYTERWLSTVVRTKTTEIYNDARKSFWDSDPIAKQVIEAYQFSAILDDRTTDVCRELDGQIFEKGDFLNNITPPLHFNCRSLLVPVTRFEPYKEDPGYVKPGKEPSLESLKEMGGGMIVGGD